jgi:hypothetical protein
MKIRTILLRVLLAAAVLGGGALLLNQHRYNLHQHEVNRLDEWLHRIRKSPPSDVPLRVWEQSICNSGLHAYIHGCLRHREEIPTERVRELADYLDGTQGRDLRSLAGTYGLMTHIETLAPRCAGQLRYVIDQVESDTGLRPAPTPIVIPATR